MPTRRIVTHTGAADRKPGSFVAEVTQTHVSPTVKEMDKEIKARRKATANRRERIYGAETTAPRTRKSEKKAETETSNANG